MHQLRRFLLIGLIACSLSSLAAPAQAMRFWRFKITRDGQPAFTGGIGMHDRTPPADVLKKGLHKARIQLGPRSIIDPAKIGTGDVTLDGKLQFTFPDLPPLELEQLRLIRTPQSRDRSQVAGGHYDWKLHPDDAAAIVRHYVPPEPPGAARWTNLPTVLASVGTAIAIALIIAWLAIRQGRRTEHG